MRRTIAIAVIAEFCIAVLLLFNDIKDFLWTRPWWQSFLVAIPGIAAPILAWFELRRSGEANELRIKANNHRIRANALQEEQNKSIQQKADLKKELDAERNKQLQQIAINTQRRITEAERNAQTLKKYLGQRASVTEGSIIGVRWGHNR
jgi:hypothetical protein